jgi:hypothetical protein
MIDYKAFKVAVVGETIGWKSAAGYLEGKITKIDTRKNTACKKTLSDWVMVELDPYFARFEGEKAYLNANFLMANGKVRKLSPAPESAYGMYVEKRRSFGDAVMSEREFERLALSIEAKGASI